MIPEDAQKQVQQLREWVNRQAHLPKDLEDKMLLRFLHSCYYNMEKTKTTIELFFSIRASLAEVIINRDPLKPPMIKTLEITNIGQYEASGERNVWIWQLNDPGLENYDYTNDAKAFVIMADAWFLDNEDYAEEDIVLMDVKDLSLKFLTKLNISIARKLSKYQEDAMPLRLKQIHVVNSPPVIDKLFAVMKPFLKQEITDMVHFHTPNSDTLYKYLKKEDLPSDYGGYLPSMDVYMKKSMSVLLEKREIILDEKFWKVDKKAKNSDDVGTFKTLDID